MELHTMIGHLNIHMMVLKLISVLRTWRGYTLRSANILTALFTVYRAEASCLDYKQQDRKDVTGFLYPNTTNTQYHRTALCTDLSCLRSKIL